MLNLGGGTQPPEETHRILEYAVEHNLVVELSYMPLAAHRAQAGRATQAPTGFRVSRCWSTPSRRRFAPANWQT